MNVTQTNWYVKIVMRVVGGMVTFLNASDHPQVTAYYRRDDMAGDSCKVSDSRPDAESTHHR